MNLVKPRFAKNIFGLLCTHTVSHRSSVFSQRIYALVPGLEGRRSFLLLGVNPECFRLGRRPPNFDLEIVACGHKHLVVLRIKRNAVNHLSMLVLGQTQPVIAIPQVSVFVLGTTEIKLVYVSFSN